MTNQPFAKVSAPSNIAFLKYWGKQSVAGQWPAGDSLSMTLEHSRSTVKITASETAKDDIRIAGIIQGEGKVLQHLEYLRRTLGFAEHVTLESSNNFPSECGIASSASSFAAITIAAISFWTKSSSFAELAANGFDRQRLAHLARMGSGSAGRSLWGGYVQWLAGGQEDQQVLEPLIAAEHWDLSDLIVVLARGKKPVSSSEAHRSAWSSPLFRPRLAGLRERGDRMIAALRKQDIEALGPLLEDEALEMHSVMMTSSPSANFWTRETPVFLTWLREARRADGLPAWFTIDAGPNVHVICESGKANLVASRIKKQFPTAEIIMDRVGTGPNLEGAF
jgi:diphosphomevalonate decarboxylase